MAAVEKEKEKEEKKEEEVPVVPVVPTVPVEEEKKEEKKHEEKKEEKKEVQKKEEKKIEISDRAVDEVMEPIEAKAKQSIFYYWPIQPSEHCLRWEVNKAVM